MRNLLAFVAALVLTVAGVGLYLDWYQVRSGAPGAGRRNVNIDINTDKINDDLREGGEYLLEEGGAKLKEILDRQRKDDQPGAETAPGEPVRPPRRE